MGIKAGLLNANVPEPFVHGGQIVDARLLEIERLLVALCFMHGVEWNDGVLSRGHAKPLPIELKGI